MAVRLLMDEDISPSVALRLAALGYDVTSVRDRGRLGWKDWQLFPWCCEQGLAICTANGPMSAPEVVKTTLSASGDRHLFLGTESSDCSRCPYRK